MARPREREGHDCVVIERNPRQIATQVLVAREQRADFVENLLDDALARAPLAPADRGLCQELVYGVVRWQLPLDWLIARKTAGRPQKSTLQILLRLGLYQMFWLERIPDHAAVHETVEAARRLGFGPQSGFINAVLRGYSREREATKALLAELKIKEPAIAGSHPLWLWDRWVKNFGAESTARLLEWNNSPPPTFARVNTLRTTAAKLTARWLEEGVIAVPAERRPPARCDDSTEPSLAVPEAGAPASDSRPTAGGEPLLFRLESHPSLAELPSFRDGWFYIQDPSTLLSVQMLDPQPGENILDLCAAPGGKTTFLAQRMENRGAILATDAHADRLALIEQNCRRLGVTCVTTKLAADLPPAPAFDRILLDAPCSNTGVLRRRVDLRWRLQPAEITRLAATQTRLLEQAAARLRPAGTLVYSTCSLEPEENQAVVKNFLTAHPDFRLDTEHQLTPHTDAVDGAYVARLRHDRAKAN